MYVYCIHRLCDFKPYMAAAGGGRFVKRSSLWWYRGVGGCRGRRGHSLARSLARRTAAGAVNTVSYFSAALNVNDNVARSIIITVTLQR